MQKKGRLEWKSLFWIFGIALLFFIFIAQFDTVANQASGITFDKKFIARDVALMLETMYLSNYPLEIDYAVSKDRYELALQENIRDEVVVAVKDNDDAILTLYPVIVNNQDITTGPLGQVFGLSRLHFTSGSTEGPISIQEGAKIDLESALPDEIVEGLGELAFPVKTETPTITSCFGGRFGPVTDTESIADRDCLVAGTVHCGVDFRGRGERIQDKNKQALAVTDGVIVDTFFGPNNWGTIILRPTNFNARGVTFKYLHLESRCVEIDGEEKCTSKDDTVTKGQPIGIVGNTAPDWYDGPPIGTHLDLKLEYRKTFYDPVPLIENIEEIKYKRGSNCVANRNTYSYANLITLEKVVD